MARTDTPAERILAVRLDLSLGSDESEPGLGRARLRITDEASRSLVGEIEMSLTEFALALANRADRPATIRLFPRAARLYGLRHEARKIVVEGLIRDTWADRDRLVAERLAAEPGWEDAEFDYGAMQGEESPNMHRLVYETETGRSGRSRATGYRIVLHRYVDPETGEVVR